MRKDTLYYAVLSYCCDKGTPVSAVDLHQDLPFRGRRDFTEKNLEQILMTAANNGILTESCAELCADKLVVKYMADDEQKKVIEQYLAD